MKKYKEQKNLSGVNPKPIWEVFPFYREAPFDVLKQEKIKRKNRRSKVLETTLYVLLASGLLRNINVLQKPNFYTNNEKDIQENLEVLGYNDAIFAKGVFNKEILINMQKHLVVGINKNLGEEQIKAATNAVNYMNYILKGLNPEYSIEIKKVNNLTYQACDIAITEYDDVLFQTKSIVFSGGYKKNKTMQDNSIMIASHTQGLFNNNGIYKSKIVINKDYWDYHLNDENFHTIATSVYIHELCHAIFGFNDIKTKQYSIMDYKDSCDKMSMYYYDILNAAASICDLTNEEEKTRVYNFITRELIRQLESDLFDANYKMQVVRKIAELQAEISLEMK